MPEQDDWGEPITDTIHDLKKDGPVVGIYRGYKVVTSQLGDSRLHAFETPEGRRVNTWGKTHMDRLLEGREGEMVKVALSGKTLDMGPGRNPMIEFQLWSKGRATPPPELPQRPLDAPENGFAAQPQGEEARPFEGPVGADEAALIRARRLASACRDAGIDDTLRGDLIEWFSFGETRSSKQLNDTQAQKLFLLIQQIRVGKLDVRYDENGKMYLEDAAGKRINA